MLKKTAGFTVIELLVVVAIFTVFMVIIVGFVGVGCGLKGNFYFNEDTLLQAVKRNNSAIEKVVEYDRNIYSYSTVIVEDAEGQRFNYSVDTNIFFDIKATPEATTDW